MPPSGGEVGGRPSRLDNASELVHGLQRCWSGRVYPSCGEASGALINLEGGGLHQSKLGGRSDPEVNRRRNGQRARSRVRRYCVGNGLSRLITLTFDATLGARPTSRDAAMRAGALWLKRVRRAGHLRAGRPYVIVPELHKDGVHYHLHVAVSEYVPKRVIAESWGLGFVDVRQLRRHRGKHGAAPKGQENRAVAGYVAKYVGKSYGDPEPGRHRYEVGQGCQPESVQIMARSREDWIVQASSVMGRPATDSWVSSFVEGWLGPPALSLRWSEGGEQYGPIQGCEGPVSVQVTEAVAA
jgi:hypothetical protein